MHNHFYTVHKTKLPKMNFNDKVVWITGASSGIGEHLAYAFAHKGARLALSARNKEALEKVKNNCPTPDNVLIVPLDVSIFSDAPAVAEKIIAHFGYISILINNAGISQRAYVKDTLLEVDQRVMDVNYMGTVAVTKATLPSMIRQRFGQIVVISSVMGKIGTPLRSAYAASKHALHGYFDCLRAEVVDDNIKVTIICPGYVKTNVAINALKGDGSTNNAKSNANDNGLDPDKFAEKALRAIAKQKQEVTIGGKETITIYLKRFFPSFLNWLVTKIKVT